MPGMGSDLVREARRRAALTQQQLAERAGTTQSAIARLENRRTAPTFDTVQRLIRLCGFELEVAIVEDDGSDWAQASRLHALTATQRWARAARMREQMKLFRKAGRRGA